MSEVVLSQSPEAFSSASPLADCSSTEQAKVRYFTALNALVDDAIDHDTPRYLADALTWTLARIIVGYETHAVAGDILSRLGQHIGTLVERRRAEAEAAKEKEQGRAPH